MKSIFKRLPNVKDMMVEDVSLDDSPLRDAPVLVARVRCGKGALRRSRCGRKAPRYDNGGGGRSWRHQDFGCFRVELSGPVPRVECRPHGVVVSRVPWAEPGGRFTRDFGSECAWLMTVAGQKTVSGFPHIAWRTAGDIAGWIDSSVAEHRPNAERVLDPFHIVSWMTDALDRVGKRLWNQARRDGNTTATEAMRGVEYAVPGNPGDLTERQSTALATLADADPEGRLYRSWQLREPLRTLPRQPVERAEAELKRWIGRASRRRIPEIVEPCGKIRRRRDDILTTIRLGHSNARIEAFNNKIKVTIRMAHGFRDTDNLIAMIKLRSAGPPIHLPTPIP